jgi:hypothetical protein
VLKNWQKSKMKVENIIFGLGMPATGVAIRTPEKASLIFDLKSLYKAEFDTHIVP